MRVTSATRNRQSTFMRTVLAGMALAILLGGRTNQTWADTNVWISGTSGSWFTPGNWSLAASPSSSDDAFITNSTAAIISGATEATANNLSVENGGVTVGNVSAGALMVNGAISVGTLGVTSTLTLNLGTISVNTLSVGADGSYSDTAFGTLNLTGTNAAIQMAGSVNVIVNSQIAGTNGLIKGGVGTLTLAGANTYSGGTIIDTGTLRVGNGGTLGNLGSGDVTNNGALVFNRSDTIVVTSTIAGTGTLTQAGSGTLTLVGENTYTGNTFINAGTLQVGDGGTSGSLGSNDVVNNSALAFNRSDDVAFSNAVSGTGTLIQAGAGTMTIVGTNTYSGSTIIAAGTLQVGDGGTSGSLGTGGISNNSALVFNRSDNITVSNAISGSGSLTLVSTGAVTLVGNNTYGGRTFINAGTLQVGDGGTAGSLGGGDVSNNSALVFNRSNTILVTNAITGSGSLTQTGAGTLVLSGSNSYSGVTIINSGALRVGNDGTLGSLGSGDVTNNGALAFFRSDTNLVANTISGSGTLVQAGTGTLTLLGTNNYSGGTIINAGTLQVGNGGTTGTLGTGDVTNNSALAFNRSDIVTLSNTVTGSGSLIQAGAGTLILTASNIYSGRTLINTGTLQVGDGGTSGTLGSGGTSNSSVLVFNRSDSVVVSGAISGAGSLSQGGGGTVVLATNNTYSGGTFISSGTLQVGNGGNSGSLGSGDVTNNSALVFNRSNPMLVTNRISGLGSLTQAGANTLFLSNVNTYSGGTWINNGSLSVRNSRALGSGDLNLVNGTLKVNNLVLYIGGNYAQSPSGTLEIAIGGPGASGQLNIAGTASLTGTLHVVSTNSYAPRPNDTFVLLVATNGVTGKFSSTPVSPVGLLTADLAYHANDVTLTYAQGSFVPFAQTRNQQAVARNLDVIASQTSSSAVALIQYLDSIADPSNKLPAAYNQIAPEELTALRTISLASMDAQGNQFLKRASELRAGYRGLYIDLYNANASVGNEAQTTNRPWGVYLETIGEFGNVDGDSNASGYHWSGGGATLGVDRRLNDQFVVGAAASYISGDAGLSQSGSISFDSGLAEVYAVWFQQGLHLEGMFGGGINSCDTMRQGLNGAAKGSTGSTMWTWLLSGGYDWQVESWSFGPQMAVQYESASIDSYTEKGSLAPLKVGSQSADALSTQMGAAVRFRGHVKGTWTFITPELNLAWRHNYSDTTFSLKSRLASGDGNSFTVNGPDLGSDSLVGNLGVTVQWTAAVSSYLNFAMQYAQSGQQAQYLTGGLRLGF